MTHGRKPRRPRHIDMNTWHTATLLSIKLQPSEIADAIAPGLAACAALPTGDYSEDQFLLINTMLRIGLEIEHAGIVKGLKADIEAAIALTDAIYDRATAGGQFTPVVVPQAEQEVLVWAMQLHKFQLEQVSAGEVRRITAKIMAQTRSRGGTVKIVERMPV